MCSRSAELNSLSDSNAKGVTGEHGSLRPPGRLRRNEPENFHFSILPPRDSQTCAL
jgi:hypothetical protein